MNKLPKGIKWSAVPLPNSTFLGFLEGKQSSGPNRVQSPVEWGDPARPETQPARPDPWLASWASGLASRASGHIGGEMVNIRIQVLTWFYSCFIFSCKKGPYDFRHQLVFKLQTFL